MDREERALGGTANLRFRALRRFTAISHVIENKWVDLASVYTEKRRSLRLPSAWEAAALPLSYTRIEWRRRLDRRCRKVNNEDRGRY